jgi:GATA-binding protein
MGDHFPSSSHILFSSLSSSHGISPSPVVLATFNSNHSTVGSGDKLEFPFHDGFANGGLLRESIFPDWRDGAPRSPMESPEELQKKDPLAMQIWKLYSKMKSQLPHQERMENLTWRMMAMSLKRKEMERQRQKQQLQQQQQQQQQQTWYVFYNDMFYPCLQQR